MFGFPAFWDRRASNLSLRDEFKDLPRRTPHENERPALSSPSRTFLARFRKAPFS